MPDALPPQPLSVTTVASKLVVYIINCVWAAVLQECIRRLIFGKNRLHPGIQSTVDGKRQQLETF